MGGIDHLCEERVMGLYDLSEGEKAELRAVFGEGDIAYSYGHERKVSPMDWVFNEWKHGRQVTGSGYVPPVVSDDVKWPVFLDGTPYPKPPTPRKEWDALVAVHGVKPRVSAAVEAASLVDPVGGFDGGEEDY